MGFYIVAIILKVVERLFLELKKRRPQAGVSTINPVK